ncbi:MAG: 2OG-Fe(II) oxygenase [Novosphingobium sp.]
MIDGFLGAAASGRLLDQILTAEANFAPSEVRKPAGAGTVPQVRSSMRLPGRIGVDLAPFLSAIAAREEELIAKVGVKPFPVWHRECSIVAHGDGDFYGRHIDTRTRSETSEKSLRMVSCVYYLNREPVGFTGGDLVLHGIGGAASTAIAPRHDRLAVFPSFLPHEVSRISCPSGRFADARLNVNCWLRRELAS